MIYCFCVGISKSSLGSARYVNLFLEYQVFSQDEFFFILSPDCPASLFEFVQRRSYNYVLVSYVPLLPKSFTKFAYSVLWPLIFKLNAEDVLITLTDFPLLFARNQYLLLHNALLLNFPVSPAIIRSLLFNLYFTFTQFCTKTLLVQTPHMKQKLQHLFPLVKHKVRVLGPSFGFVPTNINAYTPLPPLENGLSLFVPSNMHRYKRLSFLLNALLSSPCVYHIYVTVAPNSRLPHSTRITYLDSIEHNSISYYYEKCHCVALASDHESLSLPALEAISSTRYVLLPNLEWALTFNCELVYYYKHLSLYSLLQAVQTLSNQLLDNPTVPSPTSIFKRFSSFSENSII